MNDELSRQKIEAVLKALDELIDEGPWEESNFLKVMNKNLRDVREKFINQVFNTEQLANANLSHKSAQNQHKREIYIALYSTDGLNIQSWERILFNLPRQIISRPIYADEAHAQAIIKTKENKNNEAYVSFLVDPNDLLSVPADKIPMDKLGNPMLILKDNTLNLDNIQRFIHQSGIYRYHAGRLIKDNATE